VAFIDLHRGGKQDFPECSPSWHTRLGATEKTGSSGMNVGDRVGMNG
jgi:hypothetical protein